MTPRSQDSKVSQHFSILNMLIVLLLHLLIYIYCKRRFLIFVFQSADDAAVVFGLDLDESREVGPEVCGVGPHHQEVVGEFAHSNAIVCFWSVTPELGKLEAVYAEHLKVTTLIGCVETYCCIDQSLCFV
jgi:hypothetical protein